MAEQFNLTDIELPISIFGYHSLVAGFFQTTLFYMMIFHSARREWIMDDN